MSVFLGRIEIVPDAQEHIAVQVGGPNRFQIVGVCAGGYGREIVEDITEHQGDAELVIHQVYACRYVEHIPVHPGNPFTHGKARGMPITSPHEEPLSDAVVTADRGGKVAVPRRSVIRTVRQGHTPRNAKVQLAAGGEIA